MDTNLIITFVVDILNKIFELLNVEYRLSFGEKAE